MNLAIAAAVLCLCEGPSPVSNTDEAEFRLCGVLGRIQSLLESQVIDFFLEKETSTGSVAVFREGSFRMNQGTWVYPWSSSNEEHFSSFDGLFSYNLVKTKNGWTGTRSQGDSWERTYSPLAFGYGFWGQDLLETWMNSSARWVRQIEDGTFSAYCESLVNGVPVRLSFEAIEYPAPNLKSYHLEFPGNESSPATIDMNVLEADPNTGEVLRSRFRYSSAEEKSVIFYRVARQRDDLRLSVWKHPLMDFRGKVFDQRAKVFTPLGVTTRKNISLADLALHL